MLSSIEFRTGADDAVLQITCRHGFERSFVFWDVFDFQCLGFKSFKVLYVYLDVNLGVWIVLVI